MTDVSGTIADRQRAREARAGAAPAGTRAEPPRQRRPALAALAILLIVGGALAAGLLAVRVDSRVQVLVASHTIDPGQKITSDDVKLTPVASEGLNLIASKYQDQVLGKTYATGRIPANTLIDTNMVTTKDPIASGMAVVSVPLDPNLTPSDRVQTGDLVQIVKTTRSNGAAKASPITRGLVISITHSSGGSFGASGTDSASVLVSTSGDADVQVIDAASNNAAGLAIIGHGGTVADVAGGGS